VVVAGHLGRFGCAVDNHSARQSQVQLEKAWIQHLPGLDNVAHKVGPAFHRSRCEGFEEGVARLWDCSGRNRYLPDGVHLRTPNPKHNICAQT